MNKKISAFIITMTTFLMASSLAFALSVEPTVTEKVLAPGATEEGKYIVTNTEQEEMAGTVEVEDWMARLHNRPDAVPVNEWIRILPKSLVIPPGEKAVFNYTIIAPSNFDNEKVAQVFFNFGETESFRRRIGVIFYLSAKGSQKLDAKITQFSGQYLYSETKPELSKVKVYLNITNNGNFHIRPTGNVQVWDKLKNELVKEYVMDRIPGIYPGQNFEFYYEFLENNLPEGDYILKTKLNYGQLYGEDATMESSAPIERVKQEPIAEPAAAESTEQTKVAAP